MTNQEIELAQSHIRRTVTVLDNLRNIIRSFMDSKRGIPVGTRENLVIFSLLQRTYYNSIAACPLVKDLIFNHHMAMPVSHILRGIIYEIIVGYWLFDGQFSERIISINYDFVKKGLSKIESQPGSTQQDVQRFFTGWKTISPDSFIIDEVGVISVKKTAGFNFTTACNDLIANGHNLQGLVLSYHILSQQAHFSEFSVIAIDNKLHQHVGAFDTIMRNSILSCSYLIKKIDSSSESISKLESLLGLYPE
jgi:hypothetical protein